MEKQMDLEHKMIPIAIAEDSLWMPIYTQPSHEFRLYKYLQDRQVPVFLPVVPEVKIHNVQAGQKQYTYKRTVSRPMFRSYLFARMTEAQRCNSWRSNSVIRILPVAQERQAAFVEELRGIQMMEQLAKTTPLEFRSDIQVKDRFIIESPPYENTCGYLLEKRKFFLWVVKIELLGTTVLAQIDPSEYKMRKLD